MRHRRKTRAAVAKDHGDYMVVRPAPEDPIATARGALAGSKGPTVDEMRHLSREEERAVERRRLGG